MIVMTTVRAVGHMEPLVTATLVTSATVTDEHLIDGAGALALAVSTLVEMTAATTMAATTAIRAFMAPSG